MQEMISISDSREAFEKVLPDNVSFEKFEQTFHIMLVSANQYVREGLQRCSRDSLMSALVKCASDGLIPDGKEACIIPYKSEAQYLPMIRGIYKTLDRSGQVLNKSANMVYSNDVFEFSEGSDPYVKFQKCLTGNRGNKIAVYASLKLSNGGTYVEVMTLDDLRKVQQCSKGGNQSPWNTWYDQMAIKSCFHRLAKKVYINDDLTRLMERDHDHYEFNQPVTRHTGQQNMPARIEHQPQEQPTQPSARLTKAKARTDYEKLQAKIDSLAELDHARWFLGDAGKKHIQKQPEDWEKLLWKRLFMKAQQLFMSKDDLNSFMEDAEPYMKLLSKDDWGEVYALVQQTKAELASMQHHQSAQNSENVT